jgi:TetR/AcrR family transcriptional regulator, fatty acid metabolism regulator protein
MNVLTEKQQFIISIALKIILAKGIRKLTLKNLASEIGFTDAAIYRHFKNKNEIFMGITRIFKEDTDKLLKSVLGENRSSLEKIRDFFLNRCMTFSSNKSLVIILFSDDLFQSDKKILDIIHSIIEEHKNLLSTSIMEGQITGDIRDDINPEHLFIMIMGSLRLLVIKWRSGGFSFDLVKEGKKLWESMEKLLIK